MCLSMFSHNRTNTIFFSTTLTIFLNALTKVRDENTPERKFAWTGYGTRNHQVMSLTCSPLSHPNEGPGFWNLMRCHYMEKKSSGSSYISTFSALINMCCSYLTSYCFIKNGKKTTIGLLSCHKEKERGRAVQKVWKLVCEFYYVKFL